MGGDATPVGKTESMVSEVIPRVLRRRSELVVSLVSLWATRMFWVPGGIVTSYDGAMYSMPNTEVTRAALGNGRIPLLNDLIFGGVPHLGNHAVGVFYPPRLAVLMFDTAVAHGLVVTAHILFLGVGMVLLSRRLGGGDAGTTTAGLVAVLAGSTLTKSIQYEQIQPIAWLPWMMLAILLVGRPGESRRRVAVLALVTSMTLLSGHPQLIVEVAMVAAAVAVGALIARRISVGRLVMGVTTGVLMVGVQVAATLAARSGGSLEQGRSLDDLDNGAFILQGRAIARAVFGTVLDREPASFSGAFEAIVWLGVVPSAMAVLGAVVAASDRSRRFWAVPVIAMATLGLVWSLGPRTPIFRLAYALVPGFDLGRVSARWLAIVGLLAALLAGVGVQAVSDRIDRRSRVTAGGVGVIAVVAVLGPLSPGEGSVLATWLLIGLALCGGLALVPRRRRSHVMAFLVAVELVLLSLQSLPGRLVLDEAVGSEPSPAIRELTDRASSGGLTIALTPDGGPHAELVLGLRPNANIWFGLRSIDGYDGGVQVTKPWADALRRFTAEPALDMPLRSSLRAPVSPSDMARLGVRWMVVARDRDPAEWVPNWIGPIAADDRVTVWENPAWVGEAVAWFDSAEPMLTPADDLRVLAGTYGETVLVEGSPVACEVDCSLMPLDLDRRTPEHLIISGEVAKPALVTVPVQSLPGWTVTVDGVSTRVDTVDGLFLGVVVEAGSHIIEFRYQPRWWWPSVAVSAIGILLLGALLIDRRRLTS